MENWKPIPGYEGLYSVSDTGLVRSERRVTKYRNSYRTVKARILKQQIDEFGYNYVSLNNSGKNKMFKVHRLVLMAFKGSSELQVNHKDSNKQNNCLGNLEYVTNRENQRHRRQGISKYTGVHWDKSKSKWVASITTGLSTKHLGYFDTEDEAALEYNKATDGKYLNKVA